jgi:hypothetical protein
MQRLDDGGGVAGKPAGEQRGDGRRGDGRRLARGRRRGGQRKSVRRRLVRDRGENQGRRRDPTVLKRLFSTARGGLC